MLESQQNWLKGWRDSFVNENQVQWFVFDPWNPYGGGREPTPASWLWLLHACLGMHIHKKTKMLKKKQNCKVKKISKKLTEFSDPTHMKYPQYWTQVPRVQPLLESMNLWWHSVITQSLRVYGSLYFTVYEVLFMVLDKYLMANVFHWYIPQNNIIIEFLCFFLSFCLWHLPNIYIVPISLPNLQCHLAGAFYNI